MIDIYSIAGLKRAARVVLALQLALAVQVALAVALPTPAVAEQPPCRFLCDDEGQPTSTPPVPPAPVPAPAPVPRQPAPPQPVNVGSCVRDVASNDVLWIRRGPGVQFDKVAAIPYNACGVIVDRSQCSGVWCPVQFNGSSGWSNTRHLY